MTLKKTSLTSLGTIFCALIMTGLPACAGPGAVQSNVYEANKFQISERIERLELYTRENGLQLNPRDNEAVARFVRDFAQNGDGHIFLNVPSNQAGAIGAQQAQALISSALAQVGAGASIQTGQYQVPPDAPAPVVVSYRKFATLIPDCGPFEDLRLTGSNRTYKGFGCTHFANQAAMIGDHRQLLEPAAPTPPDATRRSAVYEAYIEGSDPSSSDGSRQGDGSTFGN